MNFLAHIYLSGDNDQIKIGNFIADGIRGKKYLEYPDQIQKGIILHRAIDTFTDSHKTVRKSTKRLHEKYSHYSGIIVDIFYDHYLAKNWENYSETSLDIYTDHFYKLTEQYYNWLPERYKNMMPHMVRENWLYNYANIEGISNVLNGMNRRTKNKSRMNLAVQELNEYYDIFEEEFTSFFDELILHVNQKLKILLD